MRDGHLSPPLLAPLKIYRVLYCSLRSQVIDVQSDHSAHLLTTQSRPETTKATQSDSDPSTLSYELSLVLSVNLGSAGQEQIIRRRCSALDSLRLWSLVWTEVCGRAVERGGIWLGFLPLGFLDRFLLPALTSGSSPSPVSLIWLSSFPKSLLSISSSK